MLLFDDLEDFGSFDDAVSVHRALHRWYADAGYELVELPRAGVPERVALVLQRVEAALESGSRERGRERK